MGFIEQISSGSPSTLKTIGSRSAPSSLLSRSIIVHQHCRSQQPSQIQVDSVDHRLNPPLSPRIESPTRRHTICSLVFLPDKSNDSVGNDAYERWNDQYRQELTHDFYARSAKHNAVLKSPPCAFSDLANARFGAAKSRRHPSIVIGFGGAEGLPTNKGVPEMCDFSLKSVRSRPAKVGDKLVTRDFGTGTRGFAALDDPDIAVCLMPGTELAFAREIAILPHGLLGWRTKPLDHKTAIFRQINKHKPATHHDALEFPDGRTELLTLLCDGQMATVLQLPAQPTSAAEAEVQTRVAYVG